MNEGQLKQNNLVDTTDCLEAVGVFRCWKNFLFIVILICIVLLQACFWVADTGFIRPAEGEEAPAVEVEEQTQIAEPQQSDNQPEEQVVTEGEVDEVSAQILTESEKITEAARQVAGDANEAPTESEGRVRISLIRPTANQLAGAIRFLNFVIVPAAIVYCLTMLFSLKISLVGRLGGINHIARAFFLSLILLVLLLPWQLLFAVTKGAIFTPAELMGGGWQACKEANIFGAILYYLRFVGYWILILLLLLMAQARNARWARTILRRLEVI
jgi:hypothetical protein